MYDQEVESSEYLATPATCMTPARYYKSCICGAKGTEAFAATGTHLGHAYIEVKNPQFLREKATNCKEHDTYWYVCSRCGKTSKTINKYYEDKDSKDNHYYLHYVSPLIHYNKKRRTKSSLFYFLTNIFFHYNNVNS